MGTDDLLISKDPPPPPDPGVYYAPAAYPGPWRRLASSAIDFWLCLLVSAIFLVARFGPHGSPAQMQEYWFLVGIAYVFVFKWLTARSLGNLICGTRLVTIENTRVSLLRQLARLGPLVLGPIFWVFDLAHVFWSPTRQTFHDRLAGTYMVRNNAHPAGNCPIHYSTYTFWNMHFVFKSLVVPK